MQTLRPANAVDPLLFGRRGVDVGDGQASLWPQLGADLKLFATTFAAGFLFVTVLIF